MVKTNQATISPEHVRAALENLLHAAEISPRNPLLYLFLVDLYLQDPAFPQLENSRSFALGEILTDHIRQEFARMRRQHELPEPEDGLTYEEELARIQEDGRQESQTLIGWGYLYYRYLQPHLEISQTDYVETAVVQERTLRRYYKSSLFALTKRLIKAEFAARKHHTRLRLLAEIPVAAPLVLIGRENLLLQADMAFEQQMRHLLITGAPGSGKSTLAREIALSQIQGTGTDIEHLIWITNPESAGAVQRELEIRLCHEDQPLRLREYLQKNRTLIVLDDIQQLSDEMLDRLLAVLIHAQVIVISEARRTLRAPLVQLPIREWTLNETRQYLRHLDTSGLFAASLTLQDHLHEIMATAGGNPLGVWLTVDALVHDRLPVDSHRLIYNRHRLVYDMLPESVQRVWMILTLTPESGYSLDALTGVWQSITPADLQVLTRWHIAESGPATLVRLTASARLFIRETARQNPVLLALLEEQLLPLLAAVDSGEPLDEVVYACMETVLCQRFPPLPDHLMQQWIGLVLEVKGWWSERCMILLDDLRRRDQLPPSGLIRCGQILRQMRYYAQAQSCLERAILRAGQAGNFTLQAQAMIELGVLLRTRGDYEQALRLLKRAETTAQLYRDLALLHSAWQEMAQNAIEQGRGDNALQLLTEIPENGVRLLLMSEALLLTGELEASLKAVNRAGRYLTENRRLIGLADALRGRIWLAAGDLKKAYNYLAAAVTLLEMVQHPRALARAQTNLGVVLIQQKQYRQAERILLRAEEIQARIRDAAGLAATRHNLDWLKSLVSND